MKNDNFDQVKFDLTTPWWSEETFILSDIKINHNFLLLFENKKAYLTNLLNFSLHLFRVRSCSTTLATSGVTLFLTPNINKTKIASMTVWAGEELIQFLVKLSDRVYLFIGMGGEVANPFLKWANISSFLPKIFGRQNFRFK